MSIVIIIAAVIFLFSIFNGLRKGLIGAVFSAFILFAALAIASYAGPWAAKTLKNTGLYDRLYEGVESSIMHEDEASDDPDGTSDNPDGGEPETDTPVSGQIEMINNLPLPESIRTGLIENNNTEIYQALGLDNFVAYLVDSIVMMILNAIAYVLVFIAAYVILKLVGLLLNGVAHLPILNAFNRIGGFLFGVFNGLMGVWLFFIIITAFGATQWGSQALEDINSNVVMSFIYNHNYLMGVVTNIGQILF